MIEVCFLKSEEIPTWVALRIEALAEAPGAFGDTVDQAKARGPEEWRESLLDRDGALLLAYDRGLPVGMARVSRWPQKPSSAGLYSMWVTPAARRKGVGRALMDAAIVWAERQRVDEMILFVAQGNGAKQLYLRAGFVDTGRTVPLRSNREVQMEEMVRSIP